MADDKKEAANGADEAPKKKLNPIILVLALQGLVIMGAGFVFTKIAFFEKRPDFTKKSLRERAIASIKVDSEMVETFDLKPISVNLSNNHMLKTHIHVELTDKKTRESLERRLPSVLSRVIEVMSTRTIDQASTLQGKLQLKEALRDAINEVLEKEANVVEGIVRDIYFVDFILI
jgi:flagellar FliL protein